MFHLSTEFSDNRLSSLCVILLTKQRRNKQTNKNAGENITSVTEVINLNRRRVSAGGGAHLVTPGRLAGSQQVGRQVVRKAAERLENDEFRHDDGQRDDPDEQDHGASATRRRLEVQRVADGVVALHRDDRQRQHRHRHEHALRASRKPPIRDQRIRDFLLMRYINLRLLTYLHCHRLQP